MKKIKLLSLVSMVFLLLFSFCSCSENEIATSSGPDEKKKVENTVNEFFNVFSNSFSNDIKGFLVPGSSADSKYENFVLTQVVKSGKEIGIEPGNISGYTDALVKKYDFKIKNVNTTGSVAEVTVTASVPDFEKALAACLNEKFINEYLKENDITKKEFNSAIMNITTSKASKNQKETLISFVDWAFPKIISKMETKTSDTIIKLEKNGEKWLISDAGNII